MEENIGVNLNRIKAIIKRKGDSIFTTADILREYSGGFYSNIGTPAVYSFNAQFGKLLKRNESVLKITEIRPKMSIIDDNGNKTTTSQWKLIL